MKGKHEHERPPLSSSIVDERATEWLKKRLRDLGLIVNAGGGRPAAQACQKKGGKK